ncbi:SIR2 family protein [Streptomyces chartreusis]|uniref:P-loop NTPase n=1 Tax=Streptomyces chartreusis TaxID=1969 RepID=UPI00142EAF8F|nr:SIR2 family protein [Streptomyces chartreusis]
MRGLVRGQYQLLLGAGASQGAKGPLGDLPGGWDLAQQLSSDYGIPGDPEGRLGEVFNLVKDLTSKDGEKITEYLANRFTDCTPPSWQRDLVAIPWRYIWTLNIDDVVEHAYQEFSDDAIQKPLSLSWVDAHKTPSIDQVALVHLHGTAWTRNAKDLVFDISSYLLAESLRHRWHNIFADRYADTPTIIIGAKLREEIDLENVLGQGRISSPDAAPSLIILPSISEFDEARFARWGLKAIHLRAHQFLALVKEAWGKYAREVARTPEEAADIQSPSALQFLHQWRNLDFNSGAYRRDPKHDFYAGHEPKASDITDRKDAERVATGAVLQSLAKQPSQRFIALTGSRFTGKSTTSLRVAATLAKDGWRVYEFDPEVRPDVNSILWWMRHYPQSLLIIDGAADFSQDLAHLAVRSLELNIPAHVLMVERTSRLKELRRGFPREVFEEVPTSDRITDREAESVVNRLTAADRLGILTDAAHREAINYFIREHKRDLFSAMSRLEGAEGFRERMVSGYRDLEDESLRIVFHATSIAAALGYGLPVGAARTIAGLTLADLNAALAADAVLADFLHVRNSRLLPRHRVFGSYLLSTSLTKEENYSVTLRMARHFGSQLSPAAIGARTYSYRLVRQLLDHEVLADWVGAGRLLQWYADVNEDEVYGWNARYWEQRALASSNLGNHAPATSWARRAVREHGDAYALNTLATVLFRKSLDENDPESGFLDTYLEAESLLEEARARAASDSEYPYVTFFRYTLKWGARWVAAHGELDFRIIRRWNDWTVSARTSPAFSYPEEKDSLDEFQASWLHLVV